MRTKVRRFRVGNVPVLYYPTSGEIVNIRINVLCGSCHERSDEHGMAHFLEHMVLAGTPSCSCEEFSTAMTELGARHNAYTALDNTGYYVTVLRRNFEPALSLLADAFLNAHFPEDKLERERNVVMEEIKMRTDDPFTDIWDQSLQAFFGLDFGHKIAGEEDRVATFTSDMLRAFRRRMYTSKNSHISIAGRLSTRQIKRAIKEYFRNLPEGNDENLTAAKVKCNYSDVIVHKSGIQQAQYMLHTDYGIDADITKEKLAIGMLACLLGGTSSSVLFRRVREQRGLCYDIGAYAESHVSIGHFSIITSLDPKNIAELERALAEIIDEVLSGKIITAGYLQTFKNHILASIEMKRETAQGINSLSVQELRGYRDIVDRSAKLVSKMTADDIQKAAHDILTHKIKKVILLPKEEE